MEIVLIILVFPIVFIVVFIQTIMKLRKERTRVIEAYGKTKYKDIFLTEYEVENLLKDNKLPYVNDAPVYLEQNERAVYYSKAIRLMRNNTYEGELIITNQRVIFTAIAHPFEIRVKNIVAENGFKNNVFDFVGLRYTAGMVVQSKNTTYTILLPHPEVARKVFSIVKADENKKHLIQEKKICEIVNDVNPQIEGRNYEYECADLLRRNGFAFVEVTKGSKDQGADILASKDGIKYAFQCKNYSSPIGNKAVQEVNAAKDFYGCHVGVVITNSSFTASAIELADKTGVLLWDGNKVESMK